MWPLGVSCVQGGMNAARTGDIYVALGGVSPTGRHECRPYMFV